MTAPSRPQRFPRLDVRWTIHIPEQGRHRPVTSETENVSSEGFYFCSNERFEPAEELEGVVLIPTFAPDKIQDWLNLRCSFTVTAVETLERESAFGIECRITSYSACRSGPLNEGGPLRPPDANA